MQAGNFGFYQDKRQEEMKRVQDSESEISPNTEGNEYTAAFIRYCQKTLGSFHSIYGDTSTFEAGTGSEPGAGDDEFELEEDGLSLSDRDKGKEALEELSEQFEQILRAKAGSRDDEFELEEDDLSDYNSDKEKEALEELFEQFGQLLNAEAESEDDEFELEEDGLSLSNGHKEKETLKDLFEQFGQFQTAADQTGALHHAIGGAEPDEEKGILGNNTRISSLLGNNKMNQAEVDEALSGVEEVVKLAKENLGIVEAFWEELESEREKLLAKAGVTQEEFEQIVTRTGSYLYDVKDCLEGWGDLSILPETYQQLLATNNELSKIFEKMYGKNTAEVLDKEKVPVSEEEDNWKLEDDEDEDSWELEDDEDEDSWELEDDEDEDSWELEDDEDEDSWELEEDEDENVGS